MATLLLSEAEKTFILHGVQDNLRADGRGCDDYRCLDIETDVVSNSSGSARVRLANTDILVGVKAELGEPDSQRPDEGRVEFFVDCSANATPEFEGRGGEDLALSISSVLAQAYNNSTALDRKKLCILQKQQCWVLYVDILILECGGNICDVASIGVKAALYNTKIPNIDISQGERGEVELKLPDDPFDCIKIDVSQSPCLLTLNKIGHYHVVDANREEEGCTLARMIIGVTADGCILAMKKDGSGSLDPDSIYDMLQTAKKVGMSMNNILLDKLKQEESMGAKKPKLGFLR